MSRKLQSWRWRIATAAGAALVAAFLMFGSFGSNGGPLGTGQRIVTAQASQALEGTPFALPSSLARQSTGRISDNPALPSAAEAASRVAAGEAHLEKMEDAMAARERGLPASDPRVQADSAPDPGGATVPRGALRSAASPGKMAEGDATFFRATQIVPPAGFGSAVGEPSVAQNGKSVMETYNWFMSLSFTDGGTTFQNFDPAAYQGMTDFCCDQDVIYDKASDRVIWERLGIGLFGCGAGCSQNRVILQTLLPDFNTFACTFDLRGTTFGLTNAFLDYPRMALSDKFMYLQFNIFSTTTNAYVTHLLVKVNLNAMAGCSFTGVFWTFPDGWSPTLVEGAHEVMYMGDQIVTNTGLNNQFRVYWIYDDQNTLFSVDRTIASYLFTNPGTFGAVCVVPGGANPCARADQRVIGATIVHQTPTPNNVGAAADKVDFFWNVRAGNGFALPYVESAGFHGGTIAYNTRKYVFANNVTWFYAAVGANDRQQVGMSLMAFFPSSSGINPYHYVGIDDDYNGNPPGWEVYSTYGGGTWTANQAGDYLRARMHAPVGNSWIASGYSSVGSANNYRPHYLVFGRVRDLNGFNRFDQQ